MRELGDVIPVPADVRPDSAAAFTIRSGTAIRSVHRAVGEHLAGVLRSATGYAVPVSTTSGAVVLELGEVDGGDEAYDLTVAANGVTVRANAPAGLFAAAQTLRQLVPVRGAGDVTLPGGIPDCGDRVTIYLKVDAAGERVEAVGFDGQGCTISLAAASLLAEELRGAALADVSAMTDADVFELLGSEVARSRPRCGSRSTPRSSRSTPAAPCWRACPTSGSRRCSSSTRST